MTLEAIPHGLVTDGIAQVGQSPYNPVIAPRAVLPGHPYHKGFDLFVDAGATNRRARRRGVNLLVCQGAVPGEDGVRLGKSGDLCKGLSTQLRAQLGELFAITIQERNAPGNLLTEDTILCI
jgi:hypothetical protein